MEKVKSFIDFVNETFLDNQVDADLLDHDKKKMKKNGYVEATIIEPVDGLKKDDKVLVSAIELGQLEDDSLITCYKDDKKIITAKKNLKVCV